MAMARFAALRRLCSSSPPVGSLRFASSSPSSSSSTAAAPTGSRLVSERVVGVTAIDTEGVRHPVRALAGHTLLRALKNGGLIDPECHRLEETTYSCMGECRVMVASEWLEKLPPRSEDEYDVLVQAKSTIKGTVDRHERLGCQVVLTPELRGMVVAVPELPPWDIP